MAGEDEGFEQRRLALSQSTLFSTLPKDALAELARRATEQHFVRRRVLADEAALAGGLLLIVAGRARISCSAGDDDELTLGYRERGEIVGEERALGATPPEGFRMHVVETLTGLRIPLRSMTRALDGSAALGVALGKCVQDRRHELERRLLALSKLPVETRLARSIVELEGRHGIPRTEGSLVGVRLTHREIAEYVVASRETVTLMLNDWRRRGVVSFDHRRIVVLDAAALRKLAGD